MTKKFQALKSRFEKTQNECELIETLTDLAQNNAKFDEKVVEDCQIKKTANLKMLPQDIEFAESLNSSSCFCPDTKLVIVGTITPWNGSEFGYYYTSERNKVYSILDKFFKLSGADSSLVALKKSLKKASANEEKREIIEKIKTILKAHGIAFIDVLKSAIRVKHNASDDKILLFSLDYDAFKNCTNVQKFICTSQNTFNCLEKIFEKNGDIELYKNKITICHQDRFRYQWERWSDALGEIFGNS